MDWVQILGFAAAFCTTIAVVPQLYKTLKEKDVEDISLPMFLVLTSGLLMWAIYGTIKGDLPIIVANGVSFTLNSIMIFLYFIYRED